MPLFGFPFLFFIVHPDTDSCTTEQAYYFIYYALEGLQGAGVAILHCYCDKEVKQTHTHTHFFIEMNNYFLVQIIKYWRRKFEDVSERLKWTIPRKSQNDRRRSTWTTNTTTDHRRSTINTIAQSVQYKTGDGHAQTDVTAKIVLNIKNDSQSGEYVI